MFTGCALIRVCVEPSHCRSLARSSLARLLVARSSNIFSCQWLYCHLTSCLWWFLTLSLSLSLAAPPARLYSSGSSEDGADKIDPGLRLGDYPVLPWRSVQLNKQTGWWDNQDRRDKETPVRHPSLSSISLDYYLPPSPFLSQLHEEDDALNIWMYDAVENNGIYTR